MRQKSYFQISCLFACIFFLFSCEKDSDIRLQTEDIIPAPTEKVYGTIHGLILDEQEQAIASAEVFIVDQATQTDENGFFSLEGFFPLEGTPIRVRKVGYFESNASILPSADGLTKVNIILVEKRQTETTETGRIIHHQSDHTSVLFPIDVFTHQDGSIFHGLVTITSQYFDPTHKTFSDSYPGVLKSKSLQESKLLYPFSLIKIEAVDDLLRPVLLSQEVEVTMDIPTELLPIAPAQIPMWYLEEETGLWVQEGNAQLEGDTYVGTVTHLSNWVCALGLDYVLMSGQITKEGNPFAFADMGISYRVGSRFRFASDDRGNFSFPIIIGGEQYNADYFETINLDVRSNCGNILFEEKNIPPPTTDFIREIDVRSSSVFTITGQVFCTNETELVSNAYVLLQFEEGKHQEVIPVNEEGTFELILEECGLSEVTLVGYDAINLRRSEPLLVSASNTTVALNVCEAPFQPKVTFEIDGEVPYSIDNCTLEMIDSTTFWHYQFIAIDSFPAFPEAIGQTATYTIDVFQPKGETPVPNSLWRYTQPRPSQWDVPYSIAFGTYTFDILNETAEKIIVQIPLGEDAPGNGGFITRKGSETQDVVKGFVLLEAYK